VPERLVDFHCHLDLYPDFENIVRECDQLGIYTLAVTTTPRAWQRNHELASRTKYVRAALGIHPQLVDKLGDVIDLWERLLPETRYVGEVGLDASPSHYRSFEQQQKIFRRVLESCALADDKILSIHSVRAATPVLDMVERHLPRERSKVVLHWFSGSKAEARRAVAMGCWFSVNAAMMQNERMAGIVKSVVPLDRILTETDGPFTQGGGGPARPSDVLDAVQAVAGAFGITTRQASQQIVGNMKLLMAATI